MALTNEQKTELRSWMHGLAENRQEGARLDGKEEPTFTDALVEVLEDAIHFVTTDGLAETIETGFLPDWELEGATDADVLAFLKEMASE